MIGEIQERREGEARGQQDDLKDVNETWTRAEFAARHQRLCGPRPRADANSSAPGLRELGIEPKAIEDIVPTYLGRSRVGA